MGNCFSKCCEKICGGKKDNDLTNENSIKYRKNQDPLNEICTTSDKNSSFKENSSNIGKIKTKSLIENEQIIYKEMDYLDHKGEVLTIKSNTKPYFDEKNKIEQRRKELEDEYKDKEKKLKEQLDENLNKRKKELEDEYKDKEKKLKKQFDENLNKSKKELEDDYKNKENNLKKEQDRVNQKEEDLNNEKGKLLEDQKALNKSTEELNTQKLILKKEKEDLDIQTDAANKKKIDLDNREKNLDNKELVINKQKEELKKKNEEFIFNCKEKEEEINNKNKEILKKNEILLNTENSLKAKDLQLEAKKSELIKIQDKFKQEKINHEKQLAQKENILNQFKISLDQEKKDFEEKKKKEELSKLPNLVGLQNIGATCYMNATLQALSNTKSLTDFFLTKYKFDANAYNKKMANEYYKVLTNLWSDEKKNGDYPPYDFKQAISEENPLFAGIQANDSKDLINFLLERFHQELNYAKKSNNDNEIVNVNQMDEMQTLKVFISDYFNSNQSIITDCFYGMLETKSKCTGCQLTKYNFQIYSFLEFPLEQVNIFMFQMGRRFNMMNQGQNPDIDLLECFEYYQKTDYMNGQNQMYCNICNMNMDTYYGSNIYSLPNYLIINLNRGKGAVYECKVNFPENLNLLNFVTFKQGKTYFQLYAVICHLGPSSMSGHFVAYCRHKQNDKWYKYNDSFVTECTKPQEYNDGMPYILFYRAV